MQITIIFPVLICALFGLIVSAVHQLIGGAFVVRSWLALAWVLGCLAYIILFGAIRL